MRTFSGTYFDRRCRIFKLTVLLLQCRCTVGAKAMIRPDFHLRTRIALDFLRG